MINPVSNVTHAQPVAPSTKQSTQKPAQEVPKPASGSDSVKLSSTAQALAAALQESRETSTQTSQEAGKGDLQARRLLAREAASKPRAK